MAFLIYRNGADDIFHLKDYQVDGIAHLLVYGADDISHL